MDLRSYSGEEEEEGILRAAPPALGWEDPDLSGSSPSGLELSQGDFPDESADSLADESGPILRCLKRIYRKAKKEKTRRRRTMTSVPDLSAMATIWEENEPPASRQEPERLLASWRSSMDYFNSKKEDVVMKKSFFRFLSVLSKTINWSNMTEFFMDNFTSDVVAAISEMIKKELPEPNIVCLHAMATVIDLSKGHIMKTMGSYKKGILLRTFFRSVFSLSPVKAGQEEGAADLQYTKSLFIGTYQTFSDMLQQLMVENPVPSELERMLQLLTPWLQSPEADLRERAIWSSASLLSFVATKLQLDTMSKFARLGHLVAVLGICCGDPVKSISSKAAKSVHLLLAIVLGQKIARLDEKKIHMDAIKRKHTEFLESWNPLVFLKNPSRVAEVFGVYFSPREKTDFILTALDGLTEHSRSACCATTEGLLASIARHCGPDIEKVSDIVDGICSRLDMIRQPSARRLVMKFVGLLAGRTEHMDTVISGLLEYSFPMDSRLDLIRQPSTRRLVMKFVVLLAGRTEHMDTVISGLLEYSFPMDSNFSELWQSLSSEEVMEELLMENLLGRLKNHHCTEPQVSSTSLAITQALYEVLSVPESTEVIQRLYPELLAAFLAELYFCNQATAWPDANPLRRESGPREGLASFAVEAVKLLLLRLGCRYEVTFMEKMRGWAMLQSAREVLQGVALLARALMHFACPETTRILDFFFSFLGKGSEKLKPTTIAFFIELLHCQDIEQLPAEPIFGSVEDWARDPNPDLRSLSLRALGILAIHPDKVEEVKAQMPTLLGSLEETEVGVIVEGITAIRSILKFMQRNDIVTLADKLLPLFNNVRRGGPSQNLGNITILVIRLPESPTQDVTFRSSDPPNPDGAFQLLPQNILLSLS
nr:maestro heat-like repeat-containing protein family member 7 [Pogona vitticeps]